METKNKTFLEEVLDAAREATLAMALSTNSVALLNALAKGFGPESILLTISLVILLAIAISNIGEL